MQKHSPASIEALARNFLPRMSAPAPPLESMAGAASGPPDTSEAAVADRWARSRDFLLRFIRTEMGEDTALLSLAEKTLADGREGMELIGGHRDATTAGPTDLATGLEVIVETDGSRPAFLIRDDAIVPSSSPPGIWTDLLTDVIRQDAVESVLRAVGRIDIANDPLRRPYAGTGWLIAPDLLATNRHVAQLFVDFGAEGGPKINPARAPHVDFGHEFNGRGSVGARPLTDLVFCGAKPIPARGIDHSLLDLAVFRLGPAPASDRPPARLAIGRGAGLSAPQVQVFLAGYPGAPRPDALGSVTETDRVLRLLFGKLWGFKRLAPGEVMAPVLGPRTLLHDATTLGGNSGSLVMGLDTAPAVTAIHYGGSWAANRANWSHPLSAILNEAGLPGLRHASLADLCRAEGVDLVGD